MSLNPKAVATLHLNKPVQASEDHWIVLLEEVEDPQADSGTKSKILLQEGSILRIGRASSNDIVVRSKLASRFHALVSVTRNAVVVCDLDSLNGSYVNGFRVDSPQDISSGDILRIGPVEFSVSMRVSRTVDSDATTEGATQVRPVQVVILLADIKDYKERLAGSSPDIVTPILRNWFSNVRDVIASNDGAIDRFLGDGVLAFWMGTDNEKELNVRKSLRAAGQIQACTSELPKVAGQDTPWSCSITLSADAAMASNSKMPESAALILGTVLNEAFAINTSAKRSDVALSCNAIAARVLQQFATLKEMPELRSPSVVGELLRPMEIIGARKSG